MEDLNFENILSDEDMEGLFLDDSEFDLSEDSDEEEIKEQEPVETEPDETVEEESEIVDGEEEDDPEGGDDADSDEPDESDSPKTNFYSSIATALKDEGILPDLDDTSLKDIKSAEDFAKAIEAQLESRLDER